MKQKASVSDTGLEAWCLVRGDYSSQSTVSQGSICLLSYAWFVACFRLAWLPVVCENSYLLILISLCNIFTY